MVDPARNHRWWWWEFSNTIAIPSLEKNNHRHSIALKNLPSFRSTLNLLFDQEKAGLKTAVCDEESIMQSWQWDPSCPPSHSICPEAEPGSVEVAPNKRYAALTGKGRVKLAGPEMQELCLTVGSKETERKAGPYIRRDLLLQSCDPNKETMVWSLVI